jgi:hypothetical protein
MSDTAASWLAQRRPPPPPPLARALSAAVTPGQVPPAEAEDSVAVQLAGAGLRALQRAVALGDTRPAAFELLTADALLTYAIERAAEEGMDELVALLAALTPAVIHGAAAGAQ